MFGTPDVVITRGLNHHSWSEHSNFDWVERRASVGNAPSCCSLLFPRLGRLDMQGVNDDRDGERKYPSTDDSHTAEQRTPG